MDRDRLIGFWCVRNESSRHSKVNSVSVVEAASSPRIDWFSVFFRNIYVHIYIYAESISIECLHPYLKPPQEELHYSQLTTVKYPCSCNSQIPLRQRQSITHPYPPPLSTARLHKHILCNVEFSQICPVKPQALQTASTPRCVWRPQSVYRCISTCVTCFFLMSSFSSIQCQLLFSVPRLPILSASHRSLPPHILLSSSFFLKLECVPRWAVWALRYPFYTPKPAFLWVFLWCCSCLFAGMKNVAGVSVMLLLYAGL